jgi:hypothetical protein
MTPATADGGLFQLNSGKSYRVLMSLRVGELENDSRFWSQVSEFRICLLLGIIGNQFIGGFQTRVLLLKIEIPIRKFQYIPGRCDGNVR